MINSISNVLNNSVDRFGVTKFGLVCIGVGFIGFPLVRKVADFATGVFNKFNDWWSKTTLGIRLHSLFCADCAEIHKTHMNPIVNETASETPVDTSGQKKVPTGNG